MRYIELGDAWYYSADGSDQNAVNPEWNAGPTAGFNAASGLETGWTTTPQATRLGYGGDGETEPALPPSPVRAAYYFWRTFDIAGAIPQQMLLGVSRDDCAAVYVNGVEVMRDATLPAGAGNTTLCTAGVMDEMAVYETYFDTTGLNLLPTGNTIAVEVHQSTINSSDMGFNLRLHGTGNASLLVNDVDVDDAPQDLQVTLVNGSQFDAVGTLAVNPDGT